MAKLGEITVGLCANTFTNWSNSTHSPQLLLGNTALYGAIVIIRLETPMDTLKERNTKGLDVFEGTSGSSVPRKAVLVKLLEACCIWRNELQFILLWWTSGPSHDSHPILFTALL